MPWLRHWWKIVGNSEKYLTGTIKTPFGRKQVKKSHIIKDYSHIWPVPVALFPQQKVHWCFFSDDPSPRLFWSCRKKKWDRLKTPSCASGVGYWYRGVVLWSLLSKDSHLGYNKNINHHCNCTHYISVYRSLVAYFIHLLQALNSSKREEYECFFKCIEIIK